MAAFEVSLTCRKLEKITVCEVWAVGSERIRFRTIRRQEISNTLRYMQASVIAM